MRIGGRGAHGQDPGDAHERATFERTPATPMPAATVLLGRTPKSSSRSVRFRWSGMPGDLHDSLAGPESAPSMRAERAPPHLQPRARKKQPTREGPRIRCTARDDGARSRPRRLANSTSRVSGSRPARVRSCARTGNSQGSVEVKNRQRRCVCAGKDASLRHGWQRRDPKARRGALATGALPERAGDAECVSTARSGQASCAPRFGSSRSEDGVPPPACPRGRIWKSVRQARIF